LFLCTFRE